MLACAARHPLKCLASAPCTPAWHSTGGRHAPALQPFFPKLVDFLSSGAVVSGQLARLSARPLSTPTAAITPHRMAEHRFPASSFEPVRRCQPTEGYLPQLSPRPPARPPAAPGGHGV